MRLWGGQSQGEKPDFHRFSLGFAPNMPYFGCFSRFLTGMSFIEAAKTAILACAGVREMRG
jgi:hypothetical protein